MRFVGRSNELKQLATQQRLTNASVIVLSGRRRIGKSTLVKHYAGTTKPFFEFQGLAPQPGMNNGSQLVNFAEQIAINFRCSQPILHNWTEAFSELADRIRVNNAVVLLDELSWMGKYDPDFVGKLKIAWDTKFSRLPGLMLVLCGSVSAWIEDNILKQTDMMGRISLTIRLKELSLRESLTFWGDRSHNISLRERINYLSVTGGIPRYLEEFDTSATTATNIKRLCFQPGGFLFEDFQRIFTDIFERKSEIYKSIVRNLANRHLSPVELARSLGAAPSGEITNCLRTLELSGFISRDYQYKPGGHTGKLSKLRISDNYLRFYLKYIEPHATRVSSGTHQFSRLSDLIAWDAISGLQFENLLLNRIPETLQLIGIQDQTIVSAGPYFQNQTTKTKACQIDMLIECAPNNFFIIEIKNRHKITSQVMAEVRGKLNAIALPKHTSRRPVLIYLGELEDAVKEAGLFEKLINLEEALAI